MLDKITNEGEFGLDELEVRQSDRRQIDRRNVA